MTQSASPVTYIVQPPSVPFFLITRPTHLHNLIQWAKDEHRRWLIRCADNGYFRYLKVLNEEYSPIRFLAEMHEFRRICAKITEREWNQLSRADRKFLTSAFTLRDILLSDD